jgi:ubiquinone biosynthesis protein COQ4
MTATALPFPHLVHPERPRPPLRPIEALSRFRRLVANKEDTEQVFHIIESLNGDQLQRNLKAFAATPKGQARLAERRHLPPLFDDHASLKRLPAGTVGRAYVDFMEREGLTAQGLVEESEKIFGQRASYDDAVEWFGCRLRDMHDLFHVLTGYSRDALGEATLLGFTHSQQGGRGILFIAWMGAMEIRRRVPRSIRVMDVLAEGREHGRLAAKIVAEDELKLMEEPLEEARLRLGIRPPVRYRAASAEIANLESDSPLLAPAAA